jgi:MFS transporter, DHA1 family, tetracycline resistance protein
VAVDLIGFGIVFPILPRYAEDLDISPAVIGLVVASFSLAQLIAAPVMGRLSDRYGRKPVLIVSLCGTAIGSVITGLAGSVWLLLLGRLVDGASGASVSVAQAAVADVAPEADRPRLFGLLGAAFGVGFVLGPAIATFAALGGPHIPFFIAAGIAAVNAVVALRRLPETHPGPAAAEAVSGRPSFDARGLPTIVLRMIVVAFVAMVAFSAFEGTFSLLVRDRLGLTLSATGAVFTAIGLALVVVQTALVRPTAARLGEIGTVRAGLVANAAGLLLLAVDGGWATLVPALALLVVGQGLVTPIMSSVVAGSVPAGRRGQALGLQQSAGGLARVVGPALAGVLFGQVGVAVPYLVAAALVVIAIGLIPTPRREREGWQPAH